MPNPPRPDSCQLCDRSVQLTFHHLIPRKVHRRTGFRKRYDRQFLARGIWLCKLCHRGIHKTYDEMTLATELNSLEKLRTDGAICRHVEWVRRQKQAPAS